MISVETTPEDVSLATVALCECAADARITAARLKREGSKYAAIYEAKAERMKAAADRLQAALLAL